MVMSPSAQERLFKPEYSKELLQIAEDDGRTAEFLLEGLKLGRIRGENFFFIIPQVLEKTLKSVLVYKKVPVPLVHDLGVLLAKIPRDCEPPFGYEISRLSEFAAVRRYEEGSLIWGEEEAEEALELSNIALNWASALINQKSI